VPTADDTPTAAAASSLVTPFAISNQNARSTSRRNDGAPGDFIGDRPVNSFIHPAGLPINTSIIEVLRRPTESAQFTSIRYSERLAELGAQPSIGSIGDSYDNALAETVNGLYKTELIRGPGQGPWKTIEEVELATLGWVHWHNTERLHGYLGDVPPAKFETAHYAALANTSEAA
jgi:putative transposase